MTIFGRRSVASASCACQGFVVGRPSASKWAAALSGGLALLISAAPASAEIVDLFDSSPGNPAISTLLSAAAASPALDRDIGPVGADDQAASTASSSPIPEPSAWALLLLGFFGLGLGVYRKRKPRLASLID